MLKTIIYVYETSMSMILYSREQSNTTSKVLTWSALKDNLDKKKVFSKLSALKFILNNDVDTDMVKVNSDIEKILSDLKNALIWLLLIFLDK